MEEIFEILTAFDKELSNNSSVVKKKFEIDRSPAQASLISVQKDLNRIEPTVLDFYEIANGVEVKWDAADPSMLTNEMTGSIKVNPFSGVVKDWSGIVFFDNEPKDSALRKFFPLDFFADEAAVGYCTKEGWRKMMYLYKFDDELIPLYVNFRSYLQCMVQAKGVFYWQYLILEIVEKEENEVSKRIKKYLPQLFPDFSFAAFEKLFNQLQIK